jgi:hypothetical protein
MPLNKDLSLKSKEITATKKLKKEWNAQARKAGIAPEIQQKVNRRFDSQLGNKKGGK